MYEFQLASWLNNYVTKNELVNPDTWTKLAEDYSNYADVGKSLSTLSTDDLKHLKDDLIVSVSNEYIARRLERKDYGLVKDTKTFNSTVQRIMALGNYSPMNSSLNNLTNGTDYGDFHYYGEQFDVKLFTKEDKFKVAYSISDKMWRGAVNSKSDVDNIIAIIVNAVENITTKRLNALAKRLFVVMIDKAEKKGRVIKLVTEFSKEYNTSHSTKPYTYAQIKSDRDLNAMFNAYVKAIINEQIGYMGDLNLIYNEGDVPNFTPREKVACALIGQFASRIEYLTDPIEYHEKSMPIAYDTIDGWQTTGKNIVKSLSDIARIDIPNEDEDDIVYQNVVGIIYDTDGVGINPIYRETTSQYVGSEGFTTYFSHYCSRYFVDDRFGSVVLELS